MSNTDHFNFDPAGIDWHWAPSDFKEQALLDALASPGQAEAVKQNKRRTVYRISAAGTCYYLKYDHPRRLRDKLKSFVRCKAEREFRAGRELLEAGVPVVEMLGWGRKGTDSFLLSREVSDAEPLPSVWRKCRDTAELRETFLQKLAGLIAALLRAGVLHPDLHPNNVVARVVGAKVDFFLVDVYGVRLKQGGLSRTREAEIMQLPVPLLRDMSAREIQLLYARLATDAVHKNLCRNYRELVTAKYAAFNRRRRRRHWRFLQPSCFCDVVRTNLGKWVLCKPMSAATADHLVKLHRDNMRESKNLVKKGDKRFLSRVETGGKSYVVKEFTGMAFRGPWRTDRVSWLNHHHLARLGIPTCKAFGWLRAANGSGGFLILEDLGPETALQFLQRPTNPSARRNVLDEVGRITAWLHLSGVDHYDLTLANFMLTQKQDGKPRHLALVDVDKVYFYAGKTPPDRRRRNLDQLLELLYRHATKKEVLRLLARYRQIAGRAALDKPTALAKVEAHCNLNP